MCSIKTLANETEALGKLGIPRPRAALTVLQRHGIAPNTRQEMFRQILSELGKRSAAKKRAQAQKKPSIQYRLF